MPYCVLLWGMAGPRGVDLMFPDSEVWKDCLRFIFLVVFIREIQPSITLA